MGDIDKTFQVLLAQSEQTHSLVKDLRSNMVQMQTTLASVKSQVDSFDQIYVRPCPDHQVLSSKVESIQLSLEQVAATKRTTKHIVMESMLQLVAIVLASIITTSAMFKVWESHNEIQSSTSCITTADPPVRGTGYITHSR